MAAMPWKNQSVEGQREILALQMLRRRVRVTALCARFGVSRQTAYKWLRRFKRCGKSGLDSRQRGRPKGTSAAMATWLKRLLSARRVRPCWGAKKLRWLLQQEHPNEPVPPERTLHRWLAGAGRVRPRRRRLRAGGGVSPTIRAHAANDVWSADFKGDIRTGDGQRVLPLTVRDLHTRYVLAVHPVRHTSEAAIRRAFQRLFRRFGLPKAIRVDRGTPFCGSGPYGLTAVSLWWTRLGIEVQFVHRARRLDNNAHEQMHRILKAEAATPVSRTYAAQVRRLQRWRQSYNCGRPHDALDGKVPANCYERSPRRKAKLVPPAYPKSWITRRVRPHGWVKLDGSHRHIGRAFTGLTVGFIPQGDHYAVHFGTLLLGTLDRRTPRAGLNPVRESRQREGAAAPSLRPSPAL